MTTPDPTLMAAVRWAFTEIWASSGVSPALLMAYCLNVGVLLYVLH